MLADMSTEIDAARLLMYRAASRRARERHDARADAAVVDGEAVRIGSGQPRGIQRRAGVRRSRLPAGVSRGAVFQGRAGDDAVRGDIGDRAAGDRARAGRPMTLELSDDQEVLRAAVREFSWKAAAASSTTRSRPRAGARAPPRARRARARARPPRSSRRAVCRAVARPPARGQARARARARARSSAHAKMAVSSELSRSSRDRGCSAFSFLMRTAGRATTRWGRDHPGGNRARRCGGGAAGRLTQLALSGHIMAVGTEGATNSTRAAGAR